MATRLFESDFLAVDLKSIISKKNPDAGSTAPANKETPKTPAKPLPKTFKAWGEELTNRLKANSKLHPESQRPTVEIETEFFKEFFYSNWDKQCATQLILIGDILKKCLKELGFDEHINPILGFITIPYVKTELIQTKLLNKGTFAALLKAVLKKLIADSELLKENRYNLIYCKDLYHRAPNEMYEYLSLQKQILTPNNGKYTVKILETNRKVFLAVPELKGLKGNSLITQLASLKIDKIPSMMAPDATLNKLVTAQDFAGALTGKSIDTSTTKEKTFMQPNSKDLQRIVRALDTPAKKLAALQFISMNSSNSEAQEAMSDKRFSKVSAQQLLAATSWIASQKIMPKGPIDTTFAKTLVSKLI